MTLFMHYFIYSLFLCIFVYREALWSVLKICGVGGQLLKGLQTLYREAYARLRVGGEFSESFAVVMVVRQG